MMIWLIWTVKDLVEGKILVFGWFSGFVEFENGLRKGLADVVFGLIKPKTATSLISWIWIWSSSVGNWT
ncbi:hypothetical protein Bca52824_055475 [Brassica carinata]|uniref:WWE domain-containing protein n=1 Tax=Brassica carinata TaxID=52824 RepID=A0A8X7R9F2_BRACI|nr:hypothetical protein Bca52824_055475 [Brassica carinata]